MTDKDLLSAHAHAHTLAASSAALIAAARCGLLEALLERPRSVEELAAHLQLHPDATGRVLAVLASMQVARCDAEGAWEAGAPLLADAAGPSGGPRGSWHVWSGAEAYLRSGRCLLDGVDDPQPRGPAYASAVSGLGRIFAHTSEALAHALGDAPGSARVLDVGVGSGQWSLAMALRQAEVRVTGLDLEAVLPRFLESAAQAQLSERVETIAADYHRVELGAASFDRIVCANVLHLETEADAAALVARLCPALDRGGELVVVDALPGPNDVADPRLAAYALSLGIRTGRGRPHTETQLREWLSAAGLRVQARIDPTGPTSIMGALVARRP